MALMFARLARNFIKNGYFPTDEATLEGILSVINCGAHAVRALDPCCGEGAALADVKAHLQGLGAEATAWGVEFDAERAWHAKQVLDRAIHSDVHDVFISPRSVGLLFLNPPYGLGVANKAGAGDGEAAERLEMAFLRKTAPCLIAGGVLVLIVPYTSVDDAMATFIARHFRDVQVAMAPEQQFKQCVIFGIKDKAHHPDKATLGLLQALRAGELAGRVLHAGAPVVRPYTVPPTGDETELRFQAVRIDAPHLAEEVDRMRRSTLWPGFATHFAVDAGGHRRPARDMTRWHLALALAAGQVTGLVRSPQGRALLIKGDTFKKKDRATVFETNEQGDVSQVVTLTDKFVPVINAIDFTPGPQLGRIVTIR
jgi:hypothetical protein